MSEKDKRQDTGTEGGVKVVTREVVETKKPSMYKVILLNDDFTSQEFVVHVLLKFFRKSEQQAIEVMLHVHKNGRGVAGVYTYETSEMKALQVNEYAREFEFPLQCVCEKE